MSLEDESELNTLLQSTAASATSPEDAGDRMFDRLLAEAREDDRFKNRKVVQWTTSDNKVFVPASDSTPKIKPGLYEIKVDNQVGLFFEACPLKTENIIRFPETNSDTVLKEIEKFWDSEAIFKHYTLPFKRGVLLWGPPGSGKTSTIMLIIEDILKRNGVVLKFSSPHIFQGGIKVFREIEPSTPCVILMEDIDSILDEYRESDVINILDGVDTIPKVVFLATTNYPEKLGARILNRPSRFDKRFKIGMPNAETRKIYLQYLFDKMPKAHNHSLDSWVRDTEHFSIAHLKELFVAVNILDNPYDTSLNTLKMMCKPLSSSDRRLGFEGHGK